MSKILVTGTTGYIGGRLVPQLLDQGHDVRCLVRDVSRLQVRPWHDRVEVIEADVLEPSTLPAALAGCEIAVYLVHSMGSSERGFEDRDRHAAGNFARAAKDAGVAHTIYLGGLGDEAGGMSSHLSSRQEVGAVLAAEGPPVTEFRAAIIVGSGSISFEMIRYLTERLPVMVTPKWVDTAIQPIAVRDVLTYLRSAVDHPLPPGESHRIVEIGGPEVLTYRDLMEIYAEQRGLRRYMFPTGVLSPRLSSYWINIFTPIPAAIARPLVEGLASEVVVRDPEPARRYGVRPISYETAVKLALDRTDQGAVETLWSGSLSAVPRGTPSADRLEDTEGMLVDRRVVTVAAAPESVYAAVTRIGGEEGWYAFDWLWELRGLLDRIVGGVGMRRGRRDPATLLPGDTLDFWRVESVDPPHHLQLRAEMKLPGRGWLRFDVLPTDTGSELRQVAFFEPHGLWGFLYWWAVFPLHGVVFPGMVRAIAERAETIDREGSAPLPAGTD